MSEIDTERVWKSVLETIRVSVSHATFSTWFSQTFIVSVRNIDEGRQIVEIGCPSLFVADELEKRYFGLIQDTLNQATDTKNDLVFIVKQRPKKITSPLSEPLFVAQNSNQSNGLDETLRKCRIRPGFTFDNFAVSGTNQMAHAAAEAVVRRPGEAYNPLFLWGGVGVGKTHLMLAVAHKILQKDQSLSALYCTGEEFTNEIVEAIRNKTANAFKKKYRKLKLLLIDDIQFIAGKDKVQEEFFHTFNALQGEGSQIILTSDRPPEEIQKLESRLKSRFDAGLIVDIAPPDFELRAAIALIKTKEKGIDLPMDAAQLIASNLDSPRKIEGFILQLSTSLHVNNTTNITIELVEKILSQTNGEINTIQKAASPQTIINAVANFYSLRKRKLLGESRIKTTVFPRQVLMYLLRKEYGLTLEEVGRLIGGRDHTTIMHGVEKIARALSTNARLREDILGIKKSISV